MKRDVVIRTLDAVYSRLVEIEGQSPAISEALESVHAAILDYCPDAAEYSRATGLMRP